MVILIQSKTPRIQKTFCQKPSLSRCLRPEYNLKPLSKQRYNQQRGIGNLAHSAEAVTAFHNKILTSHWPVSAVLGSQRLPVN
jgi:hypothetical protein